MSLMLLDSVSTGFFESLRSVRCRIRQASGKPGMTGTFQILQDAADDFLKFSGAPGLLPAAVSPQRIGHGDMTGIDFARQDERRKPFQLLPGPEPIQQRQSGD